MEMPVFEHQSLDVRKGADGKWYMVDTNAETSDGEWHEIIPVQPHGRLIDADVLMREFEKAQRTMEQHGQEYSCSFMSSSQELSTEWYCVEDMVENAPTIIPAEEGEP
jgi:hypothetical protein